MLWSRMRGRVGKLKKARRATPCGTTDLSLGRDDITGDVKTLNYWIIQKWPTLKNYNN